MTYGGTKQSRTNSSVEVVVSGFEYPAELLFSLLRLTLVDGYDYEVGIYVVKEYQIPFVSTVLKDGPVHKIFLCMSFFCVCSLIGLFLY